jgi:hypothetical protein
MEAVILSESLDIYPPNYKTHISEILNLYNHPKDGGSNFHSQHLISPNFNILAACDDGGRNFIRSFDTYLPNYKSHFSEILNFHDHPEDGGRNLHSKHLYLSTKPLEVTSQKKLHLHDYREDGRRNFHRKKKIGTYVPISQGVTRRQKTLISK